MNQLFTKIEKLFKNVSDSVRIYENFAQFLLCIRVHILSCTRLIIFQRPHILRGKKTMNNKNFQGKIIVHNFQMMTSFCVLSPKEEDFRSSHKVCVTRMFFTPTDKKRIEQLRRIYGEDSQSIAKEMNYPIYKIRDYLRKQRTKC